MLNAFENGSSSDLCESIMKIFRESKLYESNKIAKSLNPPVNLMSTGIDEVHRWFWWSLSKGNTASTEY